MELGLFLALAPGAIVASAYWQRRRGGDDPLGPRPAGELPDTTVPLVVAALLWLLVRTALPPLLDGSDLLRRGGFAGQVVVAAGVNVVIALVMLRAATGGSRRAALPAWKLVAAGVLGAVVVFGAQAVVGAAIKEAYDLAGAKAPGQQVVEQARLARGPDLVAAAVAATVMAPFGEEVFFRGLLLPALSRIRGERAALALQAIVFGAIHVVGAWHTWPLAIPLAIVGWGAGWIYLRTGSLAAAIVLHATFNAINFALLRAVG
jgi:membrane protease YdiL (CAAX protease family)